MKRLYFLIALLILTASYVSAQITTERCFHLDKVQFLQHRQDFWRSHILYSTSDRPLSTVSGGYYNLTEVGYGFGLKRKDVPLSHHFAGLTMVNGFRLGGGFAVGGGIGFQLYDFGMDDRESGWLIPLYADFRYFIGDQKNKFFVMLDAGVLSNFEDFKENSKFMANPGFGITIPLAKSLQLSFAAGLFTQYDFDYFSDRNEGYRDSFINMKLGLLFGK
jgi:hypothetical protein